MEQISWKWIIFEIDTFEVIIIFEIWQVKKIHKIYQPQTFQTNIDPENKYLVIKNHNDVDLGQALNNVKTLL